MEAKKKVMARSALGRGLSALISTPVSAVAPIIQEREEQDKNVVVSFAQRANDSMFNEGGAPTLVVDSLASDGDVKQVGSGVGVRYVDIRLVGNNPKQPRTEFSETELHELSESIKSKGILQPILVRPMSGDGTTRYEIVAGERRWRASQRAGLSQIPVIIKELSDGESLELAIIENVQRQNLSPIEEARAYQRLVDEFSLSQAEIAERVGKERATVANFLRLLKLPGEVLEMIKGGGLSMGHAKAILTIRDTAAQLSLAKKCINEQLSVRELEAIVSRVVVLDAGHRLTTKEGALIENIKQQQDEEVFPDAVSKLRTALGTKVLIRHKKSGKGRIEIEYFSEEELDRLMERICGADN